MTLPEIGVRRPVATAMLFIFILILGIISFIKLPVDLFPKIEPPAISIITMYPGSSARDIETKITKFIENDVSIINNLDSITSISKENLSVISCKFFFGTNLDEAANEIRDRLEFTKAKMPDDIEKPMLFKFNTSMMPILFLGITAKENYNNLYDITDKEISDPIKRIAGVGGTQIFGGLKRQINIKLDQDKLAAYNISISQIEEVLEADNITFPAGSIKVGKMEFFIRVPGEFRNIDEIGNIVIKNSAGALVHLKDIALIEEGYKENNRFISIDEQDGVMLMIQKRAGVNSVDVVKEIKKKLSSITKTLPPDIEVNPVMDTTEMITNSISNLKRTALYAIIIVALVILFFLREIRSSIIILLTIPFSIIISFAYLYFSGNTLNIVSLSSIAIVIGMVVDNAIVVLENISSHMERGENRMQASIYGAMEIGEAIIGSTITTIIIFLPMIFTTGLTGIMFKQMAIIVTLTIFSSLITALTLTPMLCSKILKITNTDYIKLKWWKNIYETSERWFSSLEYSYSSILAWSLKNKKKVLLIFTGAFLISLLTIPLIGTAFVPESDSGQLSIYTTLPIGTNIDTTKAISEKMLNIFKNVVMKNEVEHIYYRGGLSELGISTAFGEKEGTHIIEFGAKFVSSDKRKRSTKDIALALKKEFIKIPEIIKLDVETGDMTSLIVFGFKKPVNIEIVGDDLELTSKLAKRIQDIMLRVEGTGDVSISREAGTPEITIKIDRLKANALGLNIYTIGNTLRTYYYGSVPTKFKENSDEYDISLRLDEKQRKDFTDIYESSIPTITGQYVKLKDIAEIREIQGPTEIERKDKERIIRVECNIYGKRSLGEIADDIRKEVKKLSIPHNVKINFGGEEEEKNKAFKDLFFLLILGIVLVYMIMAAQFEHLLDPFIIMFSVPFAFTGVFISLLLTRTPLSLLSFIGMIMIMGIVVNNAIVLLDYVNILKIRGKPLFEAITKGCAQRLRPILMTSLTTIFGLLPLIVQTGEGSELWRPLGITMFGGLFVSNAVTLVLIPVIYSIKEEKINKGRDKIL